MSFTRWRLFSDVCSFTRWREVSQVVPIRISGAWLPSPLRGTGVVRFLSHIYTHIYTRHRHTLMSGADAPGSRRGDVRV